MSSVIAKAIRFFMCKVFRKSLSTRRQVSGEMKICTLVGHGLVADNIFSLDSSGNRDGCYEPFVFLAQMLHANGYKINTKDRISLVPTFSIHMNVNSLCENIPTYLLLLETQSIMPANGNVSSRYRKVFTWDDTLIDGDRFVKINFPNPLIISEVDGFAHRDRFCCLIAGNKAAAIRDPRELYSERVRAIRWFERYAKQDFDLYGTGWDIPPAQPGLFGKLERRVWRLAPPFMRPHPFPSYRGKVDRKRDVLRRTRFSICYENVCDMPGYITEKIFDCFFAGCVPVYWGANNIADHIPADCYIDRRQFADTAAVYSHLKTIDEATYRGYQQRIAAFLASDAAKPFGNQFFAETIVSTIVKDIGRSA